MLPVSTILQSLPANINKPVTKFCQKSSSSDFIYPWGQIQSWEEFWILLQQTVAAVAGWWDRETHNSSSESVINNVPEGCLVIS